MTRATAKKKPTLPDGFELVTRNRAALDRFFQEPTRERAKQFDEMRERYMEERCTAEQLERWREARGEKVTA